MTTPPTLANLNTPVRLEGWKGPQPPPAKRAYLHQVPIADSRLTLQNDSSHTSSSVPTYPSPQEQYVHLMFANVTMPPENTAIRSATRSERPSRDWARFSCGCLLLEMMQRNLCSIPCRAYRHCTPPSLGHQQQFDPTGHFSQFLQYTPAGPIGRMASPGSGVLIYSGYPLGSPYGALGRRHFLASE